jgi:hypothetical protein
MLYIQSKENGMYKTVQDRKRGTVTVCTHRAKPWRFRLPSHLLHALSCFLGDELLNSAWLAALPRKIPRRPFLLLFATLFLPRILLYHLSNTPARLPGCVSLISFSFISATQLDLFLLIRKGSKCRRIKLAGLNTSHLPLGINDVSMQMQVAASCTTCCQF